MAILLQHPSAYVRFDCPPVTAESVEAAKRAAARERLAEGIPLQPGDAELLGLPNEAEWERAAIYNGLEALVRSFGGQRVMDYVRGLHREDWGGLNYLIERCGHKRIVSIVRNLAALHGSPLDE